ncbi:zinc-binding alcohol dehydrogenase family protein [Fundidesulfovibrio agrisoli]|uniref:zinc-binding alcohol dehydrogenase family protein n=1 Tax=Fundidesulfovibrio agrisoli TaxID=2922717 RepID=UPI001FACEDFD|nr:zinc-binding alcohol dehydrogenase family protein [Fundidesulfovibrio agrisoli]
MKAILAAGGSKAADPKAFREADIETPRAAGRDLLVKVQAVSVNPVDTKIRMRTPVGTDIVLGWDACGVVEGAGPNLRSFAAGDRVYYSGAMTRPGTNAEYHLVDERIVGHAPKSVSVAQAAAMPLTTITAFEALFDRLGFAPSQGANAGRNVLIVGGAGGVGSMAIQLARWAGLTVVATASRQDTVDWCKQLGANVVADHRQPLAEAVRAQGFQVVDAIFCTTHMEKHWMQMAEIIKPQGRVALIDDPSGPVDITAFKRKCASIHWEFMFARPLYETPDMGRQGEILEEVAGLVDAGVLRSTLRETLDGLTAANVQAAHVRQESATMIGKQVIVF